jgi:hypothetical protein
MPERIYFDTVAFREVGKAFEKSTLPPELRDRILISPLTVFEVWSQLTIAKADEVLQQVHATLNWTNPKHTGVLPWPDDALFGIWFKKAPPDDGFTERMQKAFNTCLAAESAKELQDEAGELKDAMDRMKDKTAQDFGRLLLAARKEGLDGENFSQAWFLGIANRIKAEPKSRDMSEIVASLSAYHEFEKSKLRVALENKNYNPEKHKNDLLDAEQLIYLSDPSLCFLMCDKGFANLVKNSPQIHTVSVYELSDAAWVEELLRIIIAPPNSSRRLPSVITENWKPQLEGAEPDVWCVPGVHCEICNSIFPVRAMRVHRSHETLFYYACVRCLTVELGISW